MPARRKALTQADKLKLKKKLEETRASLQENIEERMKDAGAGRGGGVDSIDEAMNAIEDEFVLSQISSYFEALDEIEDALKRLESGDFGICSSCSEPIDVERLMEVPSTRMCVRCRARFEKDSGRFPRA